MRCNKQPPRSTFAVYIVSLPVPRSSILRTGLAQYEPVPRCSLFFFSSPTPQLTTYSDRCNSLAAYLITTTSEFRSHTRAAANRYGNECADGRCSRWAGGKSQSMCCSDTPRWSSKNGQHTNSTQPLLCDACFSNNTVAVHVKKTHSCTIYLHVPSKTVSIIRTKFVSWTVQNLTLRLPRKS